MRLDPTIFVSYRLVGEKVQGAWRLTGSNDSLRQHIYPIKFFSLFGNIIMKKKLYKKH